MNSFACKEYVSRYQRLEFSWSFAARGEFIINLPRWSDGIGGFIFQMNFVLSLEEFFCIDVNGHRRFEGHHPKLIAYGELITSELPSEDGSFLHELVYPLQESRSSIVMFRGSLSEPMETKFSVLELRS